MENISIVPFEPAHREHFERLNKAWIEKYFWLEDRDRYVLGHPEESILAQGGFIFMATCDGAVAGTVALFRTADGNFEMTKMAVEERFQRRGIARRLSIAAIEQATISGATKLVLYSQTSMEPAILLYRKLGFQEVPLEQGLYQRANIKMELTLPHTTHDHK